MNTFISSQQDNMVCRRVQFIFNGSN